jgi:hypothetical protein
MSTADVERVTDSSKVEGKPKSYGNQQAGFCAHERPEVGDHGLVVLRTLEPSRLDDDDQSVTMVRVKGVEPLGRL